MARQKEAPAICVGLHLFPVEKINGKYRDNGYKMWIC